MILTHLGEWGDAATGVPTWLREINWKTGAFFQAHGETHPAVVAQRALEGGSYHVRVSLCQSGMFIYRQGKLAFPELDLELSADELDAIRIESRPKSGPLRHLGPLLKFSEAQPHWVRPTPQLGSDMAEWLEPGARPAAAE